MRNDNLSNRDWIKNLINRLWLNIIANLWNSWGNEKRTYYLWIDKIYLWSGWWLDSSLSRYCGCSLYSDLIDYFWINEVFAFIHWWDNNRNNLTWNFRNSFILWNLWSYGSYWYLGNCTVIYSCWGNGCIGN